MSFDHVLGQPTAVGTLERALAGGHLHHAYRFEGPRGVGKELTAFALAKALLCETGSGRACGACNACRRASTISEEEPHVPLHPDLILIQRGLYGSMLNASEATGISVEQVRRIVLSRAGYPPHEGRALVFLIRDAEELTTQAANALLKTLEEPGDRTHFILLTTRPNRLLDTVRSRTLALRFGGLPEDVVARILRERNKDPALAPHALGSAARALELAAEDREEREQFGKALRGALQADDLASALQLTDERADRDTLKTKLSEFALELALESRSTVENDVALAEQSARRYGVVVAAIDELEQNVQPVLALEAMVTRLRRI